ncbi:uncharacterized protein LOC131515862 [Neofelis nebulosa]|uniref:uncharacterized protein LOC131515862 n=1 Tax=Neofelis nebulosa TaxID=61452 RepID=UPI00272D2ED0|nr:uncharacterized protein LOC131515862 [Neofelis nebulosa]
MLEITSSLLPHRLSVGQTGRWIKLLILYVFKRRSEIRHPIVNVACKCACVCERETDDTLPQVLKPGIYHRLLILPGPSARPLAGALWLGRKTAVRERTSVDGKPSVHKLRLHPQPVQTKQLWAQRTCVRIETPKPAEKKKSITIVFQWLQNSWKASSLGNQVLLFLRACSLGSLSSASFQALLCLPLLIASLPRKVRALGSTALASRGNWLAMQNFRPYPRPPLSQHLPFHKTPWGLEWFKCVPTQSQG